MTCCCLVPGWAIGIAVGVPCGVLVCCCYGDDVIDCLHGRPTSHTYRINRNRTIPINNSVVAAVPPIPLVIEESESTKIKRVQKAVLVLDPNAEKLKVGLNFE